MSRAHLHAQAAVLLVVDFPLEKQEEEKDFDGLTKKSIYGTRTAAANWEKIGGQTSKILGS